MLLTTRHEYIDKLKTYVEIVGDEKKCCGKGFSV